MQIKALIANLDAPVERDGNTEVIRMRYALAKDLVETLTGVGTKGDKTGKAQGQAQTQTAKEQDFDIRADEASNALIITAPRDTMRNLKSVVRQLDVRRAQVHIEAIIAEVSYDKLQKIGVEWQTKEDGKGAFGGFRNGANNSPDIAQFLTTIGKGMNVGYFAGSELKAMISALATDTDVNILSTPSLVTLDNEEASMLVGENIPLTTGQYTPSPGSGVNTPFQTIQRQDVGIKLKVLPQINEGNAVKLKVTQEVSSVKKESDSPTLQKREIETSVVVDDGKVLVLGGLIKDDINETVDKVPLLSDIPLIGYLFQSNNTTVRKTNLMVFLRPQILRDENSATGVTQRNYGLIQDKQQEFNRDGVFLMPDEKMPQLENLPDQMPANEYLPAP
jgi:general secretion pathway protein D